MPKIKNPRNVFILSVYVGIFFLINFGVIKSLAQTPAATPSTSAIEDRIKELQKKIDAAQNQSQSLSKEISILEHGIELKIIQVKQAEYEIEQKQKELGVLTEDIKLMELRLDRLDEKIIYHESLLGERMKKEYIDSQRGIVDLLMDSNGLGDFYAKMSYLERVQNEDKLLIDKMGSTKVNYEDQQVLLEKKKDEVEQIKNQIESQKRNAETLKVSLEQQKQEKDSLLKVTRNNEARYKDLLESAKRELTQIQGAASTVVRTGQGVSVKKGEVIGTMGNSGFSTGAHLHFSVYSYSEEDFEDHSSWGWYYSNYIDPLKYLKSKTIKWDTGCYRDPKGDSKSGSGKWEWPMLSPRITQAFGSKTCYNWMYGGKPHPALDMVGIGDISIRAVADGEAFFCRNCLKDGGNGVFLFHDDDKMTVYWHLR